MMMELKNWLKQSVNRVQIKEDLGISMTTLQFIKIENTEERDEVIRIITKQIDDCLKTVIEDLAEKEGRRADKKIIENLMNSY